MFKDERPADGGHARATRTPLISATDVSKTFHMAGQEIHGLVDVDLELRKGETLGLVGESGSGKTTFARVLLGLTAPDDGATITFDGKPLPGTAPKRSREQKKALQIVFQNPDSALNRRHSVRRLLSRALSKLGGYSGDEMLATAAEADLRRAACPSATWR